MGHILWFTGVGGRPYLPLFYLWLDHVTVHLFVVLLLPFEFPRPVPLFFLCYAGVCEPQLHTGATWRMTNCNNRSPFGVEKAFHTCIRNSSAVFAMHNIIPRLRSVPQRPRKTVFGGRFSLLNDRGVFRATEMTFQTWRTFEK